MSDFLKKMIRLSAERAEAAKRNRVDRDYDCPLLPLRHAAFDIIAEIKDKSPSEGELALSGRSRLEQAVIYAANGASAISVLTEPTRFAGSLSHLEEVARFVTDTPVMRKDFLVDTVQILEARVAGASGVLLIAAMLSDKMLESMLNAASEYSMFVLLEAFDEDDLRRIRRLMDRAHHGDRTEAGQLLCGVNTRDLRTLEVDTKRLETLAPLLPRHARCVAESGLVNDDDITRVAGFGYHMGLVGTALMRSDDPATLLGNMLAAGRSA